MENRTGRHATLIEVGPRDGFQAIRETIPTGRKIDFMRRLREAGLRRIEGAAFVSERALPQMADAAAMVAAARELPGLDLQVLVPNLRYAQKAVAAGADHIAFVLSVSTSHNMANVRRTPAESVEEFRELVSVLPDRVRVRVNVATSFDCPFDGPMTVADALSVVMPIADILPTAEIALCDTTGRVAPDKVGELFRHAIAACPDVGSWVFHGHDTYGLGVANALAAYEAGVRGFDSSFAGLGGCPYAPGATGNVATEDLVWTFERMGISTGVDLDLLVAIAEDGACLPGAPAGGRVRDALRGARNARAAVPS